MQDASVIEIVYLNLVINYVVFTTYSLFISIRTKFSLNILSYIQDITKTSTYRNIQGKLSSYVYKQTVHTPPQRDSMMCIECKLRPEISDSNQFCFKAVPN